VPCEETGTCEEEPEVKCPSGICEEDIIVPVVVKPKPKPKPPVDPLPPPTEVILVSEPIVPEEGSDEPGQFPDPKGNRDELIRGQVSMDAIDKDETFLEENTFDDEVVEEDNLVILREEDKG